MKFFGALVSMLMLATVAFAGEESDSVWPSFRHDSKNTGRSTIVPQYRGAAPWRFQTQKGIFSTPVIDGFERIYVGSADKNFYALDSQGQLLWKFPTGQIIDSAALLSQENGELVVTVPSGDGHLYRFSTDQFMKAEDRSKWKFDSTKHTSSKKVGYNWFEGNVVQGLDGTIYAGSTNWMYYAIDSLSGQLLWSLETGNMNWSAGAFANNGDVFWTSLDSKIRRVTKEGLVTWEKGTWGLISGSVVLDENDNGYVGASDHSFYALNSEGETLWKFKSSDHIYDSAALGVDALGVTNRVYFTAADGFLYCLNTSGELLWKFDAGDVIRSSPVVAPKPLGEVGDIIYFGAANGRIYAINSDGTQRWAFDTTEYGNRELEDRNDLNASPALGREGIYIAGEHGFVWHVPYDYPLFHPEDKRVVAAIVNVADVAKMRFATPGGTKLQHDFLQPISPSAVLNCELLVRKGGERIDAAIKTGLLPGHHVRDIVKITPKVDFEIEKSADGHFVHIRPATFWAPGTTYTIEFNGKYLWDGISLGAIETGLGSKEHSFSDALTFSTMSTNETLPLYKSEDVVDAFRIRRMAIPYPAMMTSLNQIGFDSYEFVAGLVDISGQGEYEGKFILWVIGVNTDDKDNVSVDKTTDFVFPMSGGFLGDAFFARNKGTTFSVSNINVPLDLELRGQLLDDMSSIGESLYGEVSMWSDVVYGPLLAFAGLINNNGVMPASGSYLTKALNKESSVNKRPAAFKVDEVQFKAPGLFRGGHVEVKFQNGGYVAAEHVTGLLLIDRGSGEPIFLNYKQLLSETVFESGLLSGVTLHLPPRTGLSDQLDVVVMADVFPLGRFTLR